MTEKILKFLADERPDTPCLVIDLDVIEANYLELNRVMPEAKIYYAMKATPMRDVLVRLAKLGSHFDTASLGEIEACLALGIDPERISFGNTIKKERDIAAAYAQGVRLFAFDSKGELEKLARAAPGARVFCRVLVECSGAEWPLSRKFGCSPEMAMDLMAQAGELGLEAYGLSFHVGSQQTHGKQWRKAIARMAKIFAALRERGVELKMLNLGGGFPIRYRDPVAPVEKYTRIVMDAVRAYFGNRLPELILEPGRSLTGDAGIIQSEVVLISEKCYGGDPQRWVYLDIGKFSGLAETMDENIKYAIRTPRDGGAVGPAVLAGPTCDSADILYEKTDYRLPLALSVGDKVEILATGAYTASYSSVGFNGFPPLATYCI
jgi:ornithine decarboxylase